ncbi:MAG TPA: glycosyltransferase [Kamptonema sp.]|nr:glycosyltransferase [Kamptonema sp.]
MFVDVVLFLIALGLLLPIAVLFVECSAAFLPRQPETGEAQVSHASVAVLVPAHNEAIGIGVTIAALLPQLKTEDRLIVIADNCSDETAAIARNFGAIAIERHDLECRGKGYALDYGLRFLEADPPAVVIIVDADCICQPHTLDRLGKVAVASGQPIQALYLMEKPPLPSPKDAISALAFTVKNLVRPSGLERLGLPCLLTGTGMAFPWSIIREVSLASGNIVEDMQLSVDLAIAGYPTLFCPEAKVIGCLPQQQQAAKSQRTRWEHGHLQTLIAQTPRLLKAAIIQKRFDLLALALDLSIPPLSLLVAIWVVAIAAAFLTANLSGFWFPAALLALEGILILISIIAAWAKFARTEIPAQLLLTVPFYILWKIPLYLGFLVQRQTKWIRTERDPIATTKP